MSDADVTGRTTTHRGIALRCPGCAKPMSTIELPEANAEVDVCDACGGMWLDWFDGELRALATETLRISSPDLGAAIAAESRKSSEPEALGACPRDNKMLVAERFVMTADVPRDGHTSRVPGRPTGAELLRCEECMGAFVSRPSAEVLAFLDQSDEPPPSQAPSSRAKPLPWARLIRSIKAWLGKGEAPEKRSG